MKKTVTKREKIIQLSSILFPILITQLGLYSMNFFDTTMSGKVHPTDLAGVAIGSSLWVPVYTGLSGILLSITPIVAHLVGAKKNKEVPNMIIQGLYLSVILSIIIVIVGYFSLDPILTNMGLEQEVRHIAKGYLIALSFGILPLFIYAVLRCFIDALGFTRVTMFITLTSLPINFAFNYLFIFGKFGAPKLGGIGAGIASAITYWCITAIALVIIMKQSPFKEYYVFKKFYKASFKAWNEILKIGVPIGLSIFFETSIFAAVTLLMSQYNTITIASHQAAINFASFLYMLPLSISMALTIIVGHEVGAKRLKDAKQYSYIGIGLAIFLSALSAACIYFFRPEVASIYTSDAAVLKLTQDFLIYAIFFQLSDAIAAPIQGVLRGYKDVNITFMMALVSYWVIGLPVGYLLATYTTLDAFGFWIGLISGLAAGAIGLSIRLHIIQRKNEIALYRKKLIQ
ncbi:MATE family efflux transporter [Metabacillus bambusae]|uniref:Probable multidrug resistance protein NorM n=1 Tax=Metabacillus bambusae TaxID=2795218 RepID=A0ABS3N1L8_9BACI|nr:MATE family efflux transporter [Metabacillus bambusae]MBO1512182.1 MATE family efflux transporter [Metabacillus bambusae]